MKKIIIFGIGYHGRMAYRKIKEKKEKRKIIFNMIIYYYENRIINYNYNYIFYC